MKRVGWVVLGILIAVQGSHAADLQFLERFALAEDRAAVLTELVPGTEDYYYFTCLYHQETGKFDEVQKLLETWAGRYGETGQVREIRNRQALLRYPSDPAETLGYLKSHFGLTFDHQRQVPGEAPDLPTALDPALISREALLKRALEDPGNPDNIVGFRPHAYYWLIAEALSPNRLRALLEALNLPDNPRLPELIAKDLDAPNSGGFGSLEIHKALVREQLDALLRLKPELLDNDVFTDTYVRRLLPGNDDANWQRDPEAMAAYLERLWAFVQRLSLAQSSLKAHVLYQRLAFDQSQGVYDKDRFLQYLQIPRQMDYVNPDFLNKGDNFRYAANLARDFRDMTALPRVGTDEELIGQYLQKFFESQDSYNAYKPYIRESYLRRLFAEAKLLQGKGNMEQWYSWLDPGAVDALKNRVDVAFAPENKGRFDLDEPVALDVWVKNVDRLLVKVFEIDTRNYYEQFNREINTAIDLDGLVANHEQVYTYTEAPLRRVRRQFSFPELTGRGVWVIEFVGNGTSSRAIVAKGALQYLSRTGPAGQIFTVFDETGKKVLDASIWFAGRTYPAAGAGEITLPFSTEAGTRHFLLCAGDFASFATFSHEGEEYRLAAGFHVDGESLRSGQTAKVALRPLLYLNGAPMPLSLLKHPVLDIRSRTHDGIESSQQIPDVALQNNALTVQEFRVPENLAQVTFSLSGTVEKLTGGEPLTLSRNEYFTANGIHATQQTAALLLTPSASGYMLEARDKSGNPVADRVVRLRISHRDFGEQVQTALKTDSQGRIALGALQDVQWIIGQESGSEPTTWNLARPAFTAPSVLCGNTTDALHVPYAGDAPKNIADAASLLEFRQGQYASDRTEALTLADGYITLSGLSAGDYLLHLKDSDQRISVRITAGDDTGAYVASDTRVLKGQAPTPLQIQSVDADRDAVKIHVGGANSFTRVHVIATRFLTDRNVYAQFDVTSIPDAAVRPVDKGYALYTSGRQIGDEYRYILERRFGTKYPGNMLERPSLLLNPWAVQETQASQESAAQGEPQPNVARQMIAENAPAPPEQVAPAREMERIRFSPDFDFLDGESAVFYNREPDENGVVTIPTADLHGRNYLQIVATDPFATVSRYEALPETPWTPRDLRLAKALDPASHVVEQKRVRVLASGDAMKVSLTGDASVQVYDSVPSVLGLLMTLNGDAKLKEFSFVGRWPSLSPEEKLEKFSKYESHELNFFLYHKDRAFFDATVRPFLANKYHRTFMDAWLLEEDLRGYLQPWRLGQLNLVEKILLAKRLTDEQTAVTRNVGDALAMIPPDPERFNQLFMTALYGGALGGGAGGQSGFAIHDMVYSYDTNGDGLSAGGAGFGAAGNGGFDPREGLDFFSRSDAVNAPALQAGRPQVDQDRDKIERQMIAAMSDSVIVEKSKSTARDEKNLALLFENVSDGLRERYRALYRAPEKTQALVENDYYQLPVEQAHAGLIPVNAFWLDYAEAAPDTPFLSEHLAEAASSFTEALLALAVLDLPFEAPKHEVNADGGEYTLQAGGAGIAYFKDIEPAAESTEETPVLVSQNYFRLDDRFRYEGNQQFDKFVTDEFLTGVVYGCQVTVTNPTSAPHAIEVLHQIPEGALPVNTGRYTKSERMGLAPYNTARLEYFFYFPKAGPFTHYPVHVSQDGALLAYAGPHAMNVVEVPSTVDTASWLYVSQQGTADDVIDYLKTTNLNRIDLNLILWRMKDEAFYRRAIDLLNERLAFAPELWSYAIYHDDTEAMKTYLRYREDFVNETGPCIESALLDIDPVERKLYQHIEYAPLINPRAHHPEGKWMITNAQLEQQYTALMAVLAHRPELRPDDLLALSYYLLLQDRVGDALQFFARVAPDALPARIQYDYVQAYLDFYQEDPAAAAAVAARYQDYPVEQWRKRFADVAAQAAEITGAGAAAGETQRTQDTLAATEPQLDLEVKEDSLVLNYRNLKSCEVSFYPIDLEMLFTRSPFALAGTNVIAGIKPLAAQTLTLDEARTQLEVPLPAEYATSHVVIKAEAAGISRSDIRYASSLVAQLVERYGQVQVTGKADNTPLSKVYVKVFAQLQNGETLFYRDGYTDLRGRFDYASSSTMDIGDVTRFAILVLSEEHGAKVLTAAPPAR